MKNINAWLLAAAAVTLLALPFVATGYVLFIVNLLMVFVVLALGLHIVLGETGQFALSHIAFYGIGVYTSGLLNNAFGLNAVLLLVLSALLCGLLGFLLGTLAIRMRDIYLALSTFAFGEAMQWVFLNWTEVTNGSNGYRLSPIQFFGYTMSTDIEAYPFVVIVTALVVAATIHLSRSRLGSSFRAVRESDVAAQAVGINVNMVKRVAFMLSASYAGLAGALFTSFSSFIHPDSLGFQAMILVLIMVVVGGIGSVRGAIAGAIIFGLISELLRQVLSFQEVIYGLVLIFFMMFMPKGLLGGGRTMRIGRVTQSSPALVQPEAAHNDGAGRSQA
jgi:ABC-type branched-chain amino acid transport system, permease component